MSSSTSTSSSASNTANSKPRLGELLVEAGLLSESQLRAALAEHRWRGVHLGATLVSMELVCESALTRALASQLSLPIVSLQGKQIHPDILELVPAEAARKHRILPLFMRSEAGSPALFVGIGDPTNLEILDEVSSRVGLPVRPVVVSPSELDDALARLYDASDGLDPLRASFEPDSAIARAADGPRQATLEREPVTRPEKAQVVASSANLVARALAELLIEKKLIDPRELDQRIAAILNDRAFGVDGATRGEPQR